MLNKKEFGKFKPNKPQGSVKPKKPKAPRQSSSGGSGGYEFLPVPKSQEERDLIETKAQAIKAKIIIIRPQRCPA